jgi:hypothetical protein
MEPQRSAKTRLDAGNKPPRWHAGSRRATGKLVGVGRGEQATAR